MSLRAFHCVAVEAHHMVSEVGRLVHVYSPPTPSTLSFALKYGRRGRRHSPLNQHQSRRTQVRKNVIFEKAKLNQWCQGDSESAKQFIMSLYCLAEDYTYGDLKEQMIWDRIVVGIRDQAYLRNSMDSELTLEKGKMQVRQREAVHEQEQILKQLGDTSLAAVHHKPSYKGKLSNGAESQHFKKPAAPTHAKCTRCGREPHKRQQCWARDATCHMRSKKGHFNSQCFSKRGKQVADITTGPQQTKKVRILPIWTPWVVTPAHACMCLPISINGNVVDFKNWHRSWRHCYHPLHLHPYLYSKTWQIFKVT